MSVSTNTPSDTMTRQMTPNLRQNKYHKSIESDLSQKYQFVGSSFPIRRTMRWVAVREICWILSGI